MYRQKQPRINRAFTLIELLVVIAIIAILAAILFPAFAAVREQARQSGTMANMHDVYVAARVYYEDNGLYPPSLFGYTEVPVSGTSFVRPALTTDASSAILSMSNATGNYPVGVNGFAAGYLWKNQDKDLLNFTSTDNTVSDPSQYTIAYYPLSLTGGKLVPVTWAATQAGSGSACGVNGDIDFPNASYAGQDKLFYKMDSMDIGPLMMYNNTSHAWYWASDSSGNKMYELHYSPDWTHQLYNQANQCDTTTQFPQQGLATDTPLSNQLKYKNPLSNRTMLMWVTQHAATTGSDTVLICLLDGTTRKIGLNQAAYHTDDNGNLIQGQLPLNYR